MLLGDNSQKSASMQYVMRDNYRNVVIAKGKRIEGYYILVAKCLWEAILMAVLKDIHRIIV